MTNISIPIPDTFQDDFKAMLTIAAKEAIEVAKKQETPYAFKEWLTLKEAQQYLGISWQTLNQWRQQGLRVSEMSPRNIFVHKEELNRFIKEYER